MADAELNRCATREIDLSSSAQGATACAVTGGSGFVGASLANSLRARGWRVSALARQDDPGGRFVRGPSLEADSNWRAVLTGVDVLIHTAARVHVMNDTCGDPLAAFHAVNVAGTLRLAQQAAEVGVRRFVFISSVKVNGEQTLPGRPFRESDAPAPVDPYGVSKHEAEQGLRELSARTGMELVIIRPPLVYGAGVKANFARMMRWVARGVPLPFGAVDNSRSLAGLDNLTDLIVCCVDHPAAAGQTFFAGDGEDLSTAELLRRVGLALERPARLISVPPAWLGVAAAMVVKREVAQRLLGSLQVDISKAHSLLGWSPPHTVDAQLRATALHFLAHGGA